MTFSDVFQKYRHLQGYNLLCGGCLSGNERLRALSKRGNKGVFIDPNLQNKWDSLSIKIPEKEMVVLGTEF